ncbi:MAG: leucyl/phenylalanyl-tRNA--protein transferase [Phycisphaerales bacterium JB043]
MSDLPEQDNDARSLVDILLDAYAHGEFPMGDPHGPGVLFYTTDTRGVIPLDDPDVRPPSRLARTIRSQHFEFTTDADFEGVIRGCARARTTDDETWINETIVTMYLMLHREGHAHSIEAWRTDPATYQRALVGGIYGVTLGSAFFGESMFHTPQPRLDDDTRHPLDGTDASKACFFILVQHLRARGFTLFDAQFPNEHINTLGCTTIDATSYQQRLDHATQESACWLPFEPEKLIEQIANR